MTAKAQFRCKAIEITLLYQTLVCYGKFPIIFGHKLGQNPYCSIFWLKFDDVTVMLSLIVLSSNFFGNVS